MSSNLAKIRLKARETKNEGIKDEDKLFRYRGVIYSIIASPPENFKAMQDLEAREDDVMLVAYPKCGSNWMAAVLQKIMAPSKGVNQNRLLPMEFYDPEAQQLWSQEPSPRLLRMHFHPDNIPPSFVTRKTKMLVIFRNPKDTAVSFFHFAVKHPWIPTPESWDAYFPEFLSGEVGWGSYFDHALAWEKRIDDPNVLIMTYEELKEDLCKGIQQISQFFNFNLSEEQIQTIAQESTFDALKESSKDTFGTLTGTYFRKGVVGDWKNLFSEAQSEKMDAEFERRLAGTKLGARMKYDLYCK